MHKLTLVISLFLVFNFSSAQTTIVRKYEGTINGKYPIKLEINTDDNCIFGSVIYTKKNKTFQIIGHKDENGALSLSELLPDGKLTGSYILHESTNGLKGTWLVKTGDDWVVNLKKTDEKKLPTAIPKNVTGTYSYFAEGELGFSGTLQVLQKKGNKISVAFDCQKGGSLANTAVINETELVLKGNVAIYTNKSMGDCRIKITFDAKGANVQYLTTNSYNCGFGNGVSVVGHFVKNDNKVPVFTE
jgi:hypothetical protein